MLNQKTSILFVDDDPDDAELMNETFSELDQHIQFKHLNDGWDAIIFLQKLKKNQMPHLIILDLNMRIINGFEFLRLVKSEPRFSNIPVVMYSTSYREHDKKTSALLGATSFITKPDSKEGMMEAGKKLLEFCCNIH
jgi:CheY-like chemotaxis protein